MSKQCPNCGSMQNDNQRFCLNCGTDLTYVPSSPDYSSENNAPSPYQPPYAPENQPPVKKKSKTKFFIIGGAAVAVILVVVCLLFFFLGLDMDTTTDNNSIVFSKNNQSYYTSPFMFKLNGENDPELVTTDNEKYGETYFHTDHFARIGNTMYCVDTRYGQSSSDWLTKVTFSSDNKLKETPWVESNLVEHCAFSSTDTKSPSDWINCIGNMATDGQSIYFNINTSKASSLFMSKYNGKFGKISLDGKSIELINEIDASDFVMDNEWIYFFDSGSYSGGAMFSKNDTKDVGIYKAKTDGSELQRIYEFTLSGKEKSSYSDYLGEICGKMQLINDQIYFLDYTSAGKGRLYRMDKDGSHVEPISKSAVYSYTFDTDKNIVYYYVEQDYHDFVGVFYSPIDTNPKFCKYDIAADTETEIPHAKYDKMEMTYENGYLYFNYYDFEYGNDSHAKSGLRMNTATEKMQWLVAYQEGTGERVTNPDTGKRYCYWEDAKTKLHKED